jgi:hypothetical protein
MITVTTGGATSTAMIDAPMTPTAGTTTATVMTMIATDDGVGG